jgi:hypothetical protein
MTKVILVLFSIFFLSGSLHAADKIRVSYPSPVAQFIPLQLAQKKGILQQVGLDAEMVQMRSTVAMGALLNGDIQYHSVIGGGVAAAIQGLPVRVVACFVPAPPVVLIARIAAALIGSPSSTLRISWGTIARMPFAKDMRASAPWSKAPGQRSLTTMRRFTNSSPKAIASWFI